MDLPCRVSFFVRTTYARKHLGKNLKWKYDNVLSTVAFMHVNIQFKVRIFFWFQDENATMEI